MGEILIGTSGFDYPEWKGVFYPEDLARPSFLIYYKEHFRALELNFSYYRMPTAAQLSRLVERSGGKLLFSIKGHASLTHEVTSGWKAAAAEFRTALAPLVQEKLLAAVLLQFPTSFHYNDANRRYLNDLTETFAGLPLTVEFRGADWMSRRVFDALAKRKIALCSTDMPTLKGLPPSLDIVTGDISYVRFHGRNEAHWWGSGVSERFDYLYTEQELAGWVPRLRTMADSASRLFVFFNNHVRGKAVINARMLADLLARDR
ncbi:MAG TPA: DUF72 domain-containing protein [bacterium]|nr:DUF72 domain-containing protein [bacterium]